MKDGLLFKIKFLSLQKACKQPPYIPFTTNSAKNKGEENSSRLPYKNNSQPRNQTSTIHPPMMSSTITQPEQLIMDSDDSLRVTKS